jgi:hypothetical protein
MTSPTTGRLLTEVGLRLIGLWYVFAAIESVVNSASYVLHGYLNQSTANYSFAGATIAVVVAMAKLAMAVFIIYLAPAIAARFYPTESEPVDAKPAIGPGDVYHTACFVLGAYFLVQGGAMAIPFVAQLVTGSVRGIPTEYAGAMFLVHTVSGLLLIYGARPIAEFIGSIRHDPDSIPNQQLSLKMLLIVTGIVAVILGVARMVSM